VSPGTVCRIRYDLSHARDILPPGTGGDRGAWGVSLVFVRDRLLRATRRVSIPPGRGQFSGASSGVAVSADGLSASDAQIPAGVGDDHSLDDKGELSGNGRWVAFASLGGSVVAGDTNGTSDVFLRGPLNYAELPAPGWTSPLS
jgi:hypothetical protein